MKAVVQEKYGSLSNLQVREVEKPLYGDDELRVQVRAASVHPDVWHVVAGLPYVLRLMGGGFGKPRVLIPGTDMAGVVEAVGKNVVRFRPGDAVFGETIPKQQWSHGGAYAEYVTVGEEWMAAKPDNVTFEQAASVPSSGFITLNNLRDDPRLQPGKQVLINGAGGGVGSIALQIAKAGGAHVTAVDHTGKLDLLRRLGADTVIDYTAEDFTRLGVRYDLIFDVPSDRRFSDFKPVLKPEGRYVPIGHDHYGAAGRDVLGLLPHFFKLMFLSLFVKKLKGPGLPAPTRTEAMERLRSLMEAEKLTPVIDSTWPLEQVQEAFRHMIEGQPVGKVILIP